MKLRESKKVHSQGQESFHGLLTDAMNDEVMVNQMIEQKHIDALAALSSLNEDLEAGRDSYSKFIKERRTRFMINSIAKYVSYAAVLAICILGTWYFTGKSNISGVNSSEVSTIKTSAPAGHRAVVDLPDGTHVILNANSYIEYPSSFSETRNVKVYGEVFFDVAHDDEHPFIVSTEKLDIKVLGTRFNVFNYPGKRFTVTLHEGSILAYDPAYPDNSVELEPMQFLIETETGYEIRNSIDDPNTWVRGVYTFRNESLEQIKDRLETYYDCKIVITDPSLLNLHFTGKFYQSDGVMEILRLMQNVHEFDLHRDYDTNTIYIN